MRNLLRYTLIVFISISVTFCTDPLEEKLYNNPNLNDFYTSEAEAQLAYAGILSSFWSSQAIYKDAGNIIQNEQTTDLIQSLNDNQSFDNFTWTGSEPDFAIMWVSAYNAINRANTLIDRLDISDVSQSVKDKYIGKAKFLRALYYFYLVRAFGGVPLFTSATLDVSEVYKARSSEAEIYTQIKSDLMDAESRIETFDAADQAAGDVTLGAVKGLLAKVYLQNKEWGNAATKAKEVMDMGVYALYQNYADIWRTDMENGSEHLLSVQHGSEGGDGNNNIGNHTPFTFLFPRAVIKQPENVTVKFKNSGSPRLFVRQDFFDATPDTHRKWWSIRMTMPYYWIGNDRFEGDVTLDYPQVIKYYFPDASANLDLGVNVTIQRYSDILLIFAEAENEANGGPTTEAYGAINQVRQRARAVGTEFEQDESVYPDLTGLTQAEFRDAVLLERAREFIGEGDRRYDLIRHGRFVSNAVARGINAEDYRVLFPIPVYHMNQNDLLEQNPGY